ncbi:MAG: hypothetical protein SFU98_03490 [Leptospiraceae bacterium]|nr:hypothetical protein [Leptospiraceae bacterium]
MSYEIKWSEAALSDYMQPKLTGFFHLQILILNKKLTNEGFSF